MNNEDNDGIIIDQNRHIGIVGAGSVGRGIAACMARTSDLPINFLTHTPQQAYVLKNRGLNVCGQLGDFNVAPEQCDATNKIDEFPSCCELVLVAVKATDLADTLTMMRQCRRKFDSACIVLLQNGIGVAEIAAKYFPPNQLFQARLMTGFKLVDDGTVCITTPGEPLLVGSAFGNCVERRYEKTLLRFCRRLESGGLQAFVSSDVRGAVLSKALFNLCVNAPSAISNVNIGNINRELVRGIAVESFRVLDLKSSGLLSRTIGPFETYYRRLVDDLIPATKNHFPSMCQDVKAGRQTEIDFLNGKVVQYAKEYDIDVPYNAYVCQHIRKYEQGILANRVLLKDAVFSPMF